MCKIDITKNNLYITKIINVIKSQNPNCNKLLYANSRHSDAFIYIISGSCTYKFDDGYEFTVQAGDILYLAHSSVYTMYVHASNYRFIYCDFEFNEVSDRKSNLYSPKISSNAENLFYKLLKAYTSPSNTSFAECMSILYDIYNIILMSSDMAYIGNIKKDKILKTKEYIDANFKNPSLSVSFLAENVSMSEVYFRKLFKSQYNILPSQYINSIRLKKAKELMKYPFLTLEECALQSGFSSLQYFCRIFKKATGTTPSKYRNRKN